MPPWIVATMLIASVGVLVLVYTRLSTSAEPENPCESGECSYHDRTSSQQPRQSNNYGSINERYDTQPNFRERRECEEDCPICLDPIYIQPQHTLPCKHRLHSDCYNRFRSQSDVCPICRHSL